MITLWRNSSRNSLTFPGPTFWNTRILILFFTYILVLNCWLHSLNSSLKGKQIVQVIYPGTYLNTPDSNISPELCDSPSHRRLQSESPAHSLYSRRLQLHAEHSSRGCPDSPHWSVSESASSPASYSPSELRQQHWTPCLCSTLWSPCPALQKSWVHYSRIYMYSSLSRIS